MNLAIAILIYCQTTVPADPIQAAFAVTKKRLEGFEESRAELERIAKSLFQLGDPRKPQKGESVDGYFDRVERIYRQRAQGLVLLQMEYQESLRTRFELEADLKYYLGELVSKDKEFAAQQRQKLARRNAAKVRSEQLENELLAVQSALYQVAEKEQTLLRKKDSRAGQETQSLAELNEDIKRCKAGYDKSKALDDATKLQEKYAKSSLPELREALRDVDIRAYAAKFEYQCLEYDLSPAEPTNAQKLLGERFEQIVQEADKTIRETTELEKRAARAAVLARELRDHMRERATVRGSFARRKQLLEFMGDEDRRIVSLRIIAGPPTEAQREAAINRNMEDLWGKASEDEVQRDANKVTRIMKALLGKASEDEEAENSAANGCAKKSPAPAAPAPTPPTSPNDPFGP